MEEWKTLFYNEVEYKNLEISNNGNIRYKNGKHLRKFIHSGIKRYLTYIKINNKQISFVIDRAVLENWTCYSPYQATYTKVIHIDGDISNCKIQNLLVEHQYDKNKPILINSNKDGFEYLDGEKWASLKYRGDYYKEYEISNFGRIKNVNRRTIKPVNLYKSGAYEKKRLLPRTSISHNNHQISVNVARAVIETFTGQELSTNGFEINFIDGNPLNCRLDNLKLLKRNSGIPYKYESVDNKSIKVYVGDDYFIIDSNLLADVMDYVWTASKPTKIGSIYFICSALNKPLHRFVLETKYNEIDFYDRVIDHIDGDTRNNRLNNLRLVPSFINCSNQHNHKKHYKDYGKYLLVCFIIRGKKYAEKIYKEDYETEEECVFAAEEKFKQLTNLRENQLKEDISNDAYYSMERSLRWMLNNGSNEFFNIFNKYGFSVDCNNKAISV